MGPDGFPGQFCEDHALLGAVLDPGDDADDGAVKLLLRAERLAAASADGIPVHEGLVSAETLGLVVGDPVSESEAALCEEVGVAPFRDVTVAIGAARVSRGSGQGSLVRNRSIPVLTCQHRVST